MGVATWPAGLPQRPQVGGYSNTEKDNVLSSNMSYGPDKLRQRTTAVLRNVNMIILVDQTEMALLDDFYTNTVKKVLIWDWIDHRNDNPAEYRFKRGAPPEYTPWSTAGVWNARLTLELMP